MTKGQIRANIPKSRAQVVPDEDLSDLKGDIPIREHVGPGSVNFPGIIMELRKHYRAGAPNDDYVHLAIPDSSIAHLESGTQGLWTKNGVDFARLCVGSLPGQGKSAPAIQVNTAQQVQYEHDIWFQETA